MPDSATYTFEHEFELTPELYSEFHALYARKSRWLRRCALLAVGIACLFSSFTLLLGLVLLALFVLAVLLPTWLPQSSLRAFDLNTHLHGPITYGVSDSHLWASGSQFEQKCVWANVAAFEERGAWIRVHPKGQNKLYFKVEDLRNASIYKDVVQSAARYGEKYARSFTVNGRTHR